MIGPLGPFGSDAVTMIGMPASLAIFANATVFRRRSSTGMSLTVGNSPVWWSSSSRTGGLREKLMHPDLVGEFVAEYHREQSLLRRERGARLADLQRELAQVEAKIANMITAIADGLYQPSMKASMQALEIHKAEITTELAGSAEDAVLLHPRMATVYEGKVDDLIAALNTPNCRAEAAEILRGMISEVRAVPEGEGVLALDLVGDLAGILGHCGNDKAP